MRISLYLAPLLFLNFTLSSGMAMSGEGIQTQHGSLKWADLMALPAQVAATQQKVASLENRLYLFCALGAAVGVGAIIYLKWFDDKETQETDSHDQNDLALIVQQ